MKEKKLYESFGQLIYVLAMADGTIQEEELDVIEKKLAKHPHGKEIKWAFEAEIKKKSSPKKLFKKAIAQLEKNGADRRYFFIIDLLEEIAEASNGIDKDEEELINSVKNKMQTSLKSEIERINKEFTSFPPLSHVVLESRSFLEWSSMYFIHSFIPKRIKGNNRPVLLLPPFLGTDRSTKFIRKYLERQGFKVYKWKLGVNLVRSHYLAPLDERLEEIAHKHKEKVSIVGWSGGGMLAKILANRHPEKIAQLVTIGSPVWGLNDLKTSLNKLYEILKGRSLADKSEDFHDELEAIPPMPITCIYTKTDGVVPWKQCMEAETLRKNIQNIEVYGSHGGLGANPTVLMAVANALHQNLEGKVVNKIPNNIEKVFYPSFWRRAKV